jgi:hypothetical protein
MRGIWPGYLKKELSRLVTMDLHLSWLSTLEAEFYLEEDVRCHGGANLNPPKSLDHSAPHKPLVIATGETHPRLDPADFNGYG